MRRGVRESLGLWMVLLVVLALVGLAWLSSHPEAPILDRAAELPLIGDRAGGWVEAFKRYFGGGRRGVGEGPRQGVEAGRQTAGGSDEAESAVETIYVGPRPRVWVRQGQELRAAPRADADRLAEADAYVNLPYSERRGDWYLVEIGDDAGWAHVPAASPAEPLLGRDATPVLPLPGAEVETEVLELALGSFSRLPRMERFGAYRALTDVSDPQLLALGRAIGDSLEEAYAERYGVTPIDRPRETILLYAQELDFHRFRRERRGVGHWARGFASPGLATLFAGERSEVEVASTLTHELVHLLNRRAIGPALPTWLDEGLATDLGYSRVTTERGIDPSRLSYRRTEVAGGFLRIGGRVQLEIVLDELGAGTLPSLETVLTLDWSQDNDNNDHYPRVGFLIRYLLDEPRLAARFRRYLRAISEGAPATPEALLAHLDLEWSSLDRGFHAWVASYGASVSASVAADPSTSE